MAILQTRNSILCKLRIRGWDDAQPASVSLLWGNLSNCFTPSFGAPSSPGGGPWATSAHALVLDQQVLVIEPRRFEHLQWQEPLLLTAITATSVSGILFATPFMYSRAHLTQSDTLHAATCMLVPQPLRCYALHSSAPHAEGQAG